MDGNISEQQQVEEIKKWLHDNGSAILVGLVIGLAGVFGWRTYIGTQHESAQKASTAYTQMVDSYQAGNSAAAVLAGKDIISEYGKTSYASFSALLMAGIKVEMGDKAAAVGHLQWVIDNAKQPELQQLAMLRLARLQLAEKKFDEAFKQVEAMDAAQYVVLRAELLGDLYRAKGDKEKARGAYQDALKAIGPGTEGLRESIGMKLDAVGGAPAAGQLS